MRRKRQSFTISGTGLTAAGMLQRTCACGQHAGGGTCEACLQRQGTQETTGTPVPSIVHEVLTTPSQPLDAAPRAALEPRFGQDFSRVRIGASSRGVEALFQSGHVQAKLAVAPQHSPSEQIADRVAQQVVHQRTAAGAEQNLSQLEAMGSSAAGSGGAQLPGLPEDPGMSLSSTTRNSMEQSFGRDFGKVRLHTSLTARMTAAHIGARAFAHGNDIWLGPGESESDSSLMAHELAHVVQQDQDAIYLRRATWLERRAWLSFFSHYLPRKLLNNYMDDTGTSITLTQQEMIDCNPIVDLRRSPTFLNEVVRLRAAGGGTSTISVSGWGGTLTNGTLGNFTINYQGDLHVTPTGDWSFSGTMDFYDFWDFDPKAFGSGSGRPIPAEIKVRVAAYGLPGRPFDIRSVRVPISQASADARATWAGASPMPVREPSARTGADIEVGAGGGEVAGGEIGGGAGAEVGAQSAEDLNR